MKTPLTHEGVLAAVEQAKQKPPVPPPPAEKAPLEAVQATQMAVEEQEEPEVIDKVGRANAFRWLENTDGKKAKKPRGGGRGALAGPGRGRGLGGMSSKKRKGSDSLPLPDVGAATRSSATMAAPGIEVSDSANIGGESLMSQGLISTASKRLRGKTPVTATEKMRSQAEKYLGLLQPLDALEGKALGNTRYNGERAAQALKEEGEADTSLFINLTAKVRTFTQCERLANLKALTPKERVELLSEVVPSLGALPPDFCVKIALSDCA